MLAKHNFELIETSDVDDLNDLTKDENDVLLDWEAHFQNKYVQVGELINRK